MVFTREELLDKIYGCWVGKNIGGTIGTPYEGKQELLDVKGFVTEPGKPLANDDLDLQLVWLRAMEERGIKGVNAQVLGEYWLDFITPHWNEYGTGKGNLRGGLPAPLSGAVDNAWQHSNGAWIRSEIWACALPGNPDLASRYGYYDACVDHGMGEGTYAAIFTTAIESAAFVESDLRKLIAIGLERVPADSLLAQCVNIVIDAQKEGLDWVAARQRVLDFSLPKLGWFQAPANVAFVVLGLLYGEGDFKRSMILATNCGDDTDCTAATVGALFGILKGASGLPADWKQYIGDEIITVALNRGEMWTCPKTCTELAERAYRLLEQAVPLFGLPIAISRPIAEDPAPAPDLAPGYEARELCQKSPFAADYDFTHMKVTFDYQRPPVVAEGAEFPVRVHLENLAREPRYINIRWLLPEGWQVKNCPQRVYLHHGSHLGVTTPRLDIDATIIAGPKQPRNRGVLELVDDHRPTVGLVPLMFL